MDILFSPYGVGGMPKSAMAEIEKRTEDLLKSSSFQRMLELEKKYKMERLRGPQPLLPSSQQSGQLKGAPPPRPERPESSFPQEQFLMVKATGRTIIPPSLSITIPQAVDNERRGRPSEWEDEQEAEEYADTGTPTNSEPFQKQVKFLAPDDDQDEEDGMSEQSSICQSPSWEGYGQRKKEKKLEAERRRREKEQAEKDAKAAKKRNTARLSKVPPHPVTATRNSRLAGLTAADRSMSDPLLVTRHLQQSAQSIRRPEEVGRTASADDLQQSRWHRPAVTEVLSGSDSNSRREGGVAIDEPSPSAIPRHLLCDSEFVPLHDLHRTVSEGPGIPTHHPSSAFPPRHDSRSPRAAAFPPSASRTPRLRHMSPSAANRSNGLFQVAPNANHSQESLSAAATADGARRNGYVVQQRAQAAERALAGLADEQLVGNVGQYYPPSRSSSGQTQHTRRPSLTQEAKTVAMKLVGMKTPSSARDSASQTDYLTFKAIPYSSSGSGADASGSSMPASPRSVDGSFQTLVDERPSTSVVPILRTANELHETSTTLERPTTSQSSLSSSGPSIIGSAPGSQGKKTRSLKDAAKAALAISKGPQKPTDDTSTSVSLPPFLALRARLQSRTSVHTENKTSQAVNSVPDLASHPRPATSVCETAKSKDMPPQEHYRASEGSSSSSAFEDGSPLPSPTTTPDTSRPQSAKDIPLAAAEPPKGKAESPGLLDDERTLHQSLGSSTSSTPRVGDSEPRESIEVGNEDRWSRTALPIDIDCDAQSFMTTVSNFDNVDDTDPASSNSPPSPQAGTEQPSPLNLGSNSIRSGDAEPPLTIPPRSRKRSQSQATSIGSPTASSPSEAEQHGSAETGQNTMEVSAGHGETPIARDSPRSRASRNYARPFQQMEQKEMVAGLPERHTKQHEGKSTKTARHDTVVEVKEQTDEEMVQVAPRSPQSQATPGSISLANSTAPSAGTTSPNAFSAEFQIPSNPYFAEFPEPLRHPGMLGEIPTSPGPPSPVSLPSPLHPVPSKPPAQPRANSAPTPALASTATSRASTPSARPPGAAPVSILKQPKTSSSSSSATTPDHRPQVLSALPKHMQLQAGVTQRPPPPPAAPIAKMFVECCSCKFYHDMPSKIYECMAKPDAVIEDRLLGISGAITTMVKCPWCQHNMSRDCCAGYAAVVYLKEKLH